MKSIGSLLVLTLIPLFISCSDNDDNDSEPGSALVGTWNLTALDVTDGAAVVTTGGTSTNGAFSAVGKEYDATLSFTQDPNNVSYDGEYSVTLEYSLLGQSVTQEVPGEPLTGTAEWSVVGDSLFTTEGGVTTSFLIKQLTANNLVLERAFDQSREVNGQSVQLMGTLNASLTK